MQVRKLYQAFVAVRRLIKNPEDTEQVFRVLGSLRGKAHERLFERLRHTEVGQQVLDGGRNLADTLTDRDRLSLLPEGSLGRTYYEFTEQEELTAYGLVHASKEAIQSIQDERFRRVAGRLRDSHDLWHVVTAYGRDPLGEACLLAFTHAQTKNPAILFLLVMVFKQLARGYGKGVLRALRKSRHDGKQAVWLPATDWEALLDQPVEKIRRDLRIGTPDRYRVIRNRVELATAS